MDEDLLVKAVNLALNGDWHGAHNIAQDFNDSNANWLHAVLHKIEGDIGNSRYWYAKTNGRNYEDMVDSQLELQAILTHLQD